MTWSEFLHLVSNADSKKYWSFWQFKTVSTLKIYSSENILTMDPIFLKHHSSLQTFMKCTGILVDNLSPKSIWSLFWFTFSSRLHLLSLLLPGFSWMLLLMSMIFWGQFLYKMSTFCHLSFSVTIFHHNILEK